MEFITRGRPCENGAHEQFHRVYQAEVVPEPAQHRRGQQRRSDRWLRFYNEERPHKGLGMKVPGALYRQNRRRLPQQTKPWGGIRGVGDGSKAAERLLAVGIGVLSGKRL